MTLDELMQAEKRTVGVKQTEKAVAKGSALKVYVARDADERVTEKLVELCEEKAVTVVKVETMHELGKACGIHVKAAAAAILNP
ncbi:MAG: ribosomal L7Ae/L30e/S12e/Gadd45 family protein [Acidaminococcaceae bacterium]|nr:ribosomal L7Ae/L30e/S12e/Gadd45 family protein [Acidaminococcaceae bacterium]